LVLGLRTKYSRRLSRAASAFSRANFFGLVTIFTFGTSFFSGLALRNAADVRFVGFMDPFLRVIPAPPIYFAEAGFSSVEELLRLSEA
jgi:hypothetical protein